MKIKNILKKILFEKKEWISFQKKKIPLISFIEKISPSKRNFYKVFSNSYHKSFILECKKASPLKGIIRSKFNIEKIVSIYKNYASVISVVTDEKYFQGNFNFIQQASNIAHQPILCKDFIIDPWQIYFSRLYQADAILLMLSILDNETYLHFCKIAKKLNMGVLTEINNEKELKRALFLGSKVIGINNRNLDDLSIDLNRTKNLASLIPNNIIKISESGIFSYKEVKKLSSFVNGFLIGTSLMKEKDLDFGIRKIMLGENKVCGLTNHNDAFETYKAGAVYGGLIFFKKSIRSVNIKDAFYIKNNIDNLKFVGVFCNESIKKIIHLVISLKLSVIQLHGNENEIYINKLQDMLPIKCKIWKSFNMEIYNSKFIDKFYKKVKIHRCLLDNHTGGTGKKFNWKKIKNLNLKKIILAGGLSEKNCKKAMSLGCAGLDFNSGIESSPGIKNHKKLHSVFKILKSY